MAVEDSRACVRFILCSTGLRPTPPDPPPPPPTPPPIPITQHAEKMTCNIYGHYEWTTSGQEAVLVHSIQDLSIRDHTCWSKRQVSFSQMIEMGRVGPGNLAACQIMCRRDPDCTHTFEWKVDPKRNSGSIKTPTPGHYCMKVAGICSDTADPACQFKGVTTMERYTGCGERHSCIEIHLQNFHYLSGKYCFQGENAARRSQGPVYFKHGMTPQARALAPLA